jgi:lipopolysaccharide biosynthesis protein
MTDSRYIRIKGRPLLIVYRPGLLPSAAKTADRWRKWCRSNGIGEIYLAYVQSFDKMDPASIGYDAAVEFPPNSHYPPLWYGKVRPLVPDFKCKIYDWNDLVKRSEHYATPGYTLLRGVCPSWDNTPRRKNAGTVFVNSHPDEFQRWVANAARDTCRRFADRDERLVFVNAWNEWAEGACLEPDKKHGYAYLQAIYEALTKVDDQMMINKLQGRN